MTDMKRRKTLTERLQAKLEALGLSPRKAKELSPRIAVTARKVQSSEKIAVRLVKLGLTEKKAKDFSKGLASVARAFVKSQGTGPQKSVTEPEDLTPKVEVIPSVHGGKNLPVMQVIHGLTTSASYLVTAVKGEAGLVAVRKMYNDSYKVKFYPSMDYWGFSFGDLQGLGFHSHLSRVRENLYDRVCGGDTALAKLQDRLVAMQPKKTTLQKLASRFKALAFRAFAGVMRPYYSKENVQEKVSA